MRRYLLDDLSRMTYRDASSARNVFRAFTIESRVIVGDRIIS
ncbi:hypothetical protein [Microlunatus soli]|uniref:Uncharacterized protein n=1 Tax=Microlunatus soli TaxID=630515 RepID=A0A1H1TWP9_9ACTN|nr:hypothetical protein [Microlunatus soli]SDS64554.1 hypothetical protein SAMN04489812_2547 [Microlunatus soli]